MITISLFHLIGYAAGLFGLTAVGSTIYASAQTRKNTRDNILSILRVWEVDLARQLLEELERLESKDWLEGRELAKVQHGTVKRFALDRLGPPWLRARHGRNIPELKPRLTAFIKGDD